MRPRDKNKHKYLGLHSPLLQILTFEENQHHINDTTCARAWGFHVGLVSYRFLANRHIQLEIMPFNCTTGRNVRFACLQIYFKSCYKFQICNDLPHLHACKLLICTRGKLGGKCGNGREAVRRKSVANPLQTNYFATSLHACKFNANTKFASDLHIRKSVDYIKLANGLQTCKLVANMKFAIGLHHVLYVRKLVANNKFASDLHIRKCVDYTNYTKPLV